MGAPLTFLPAVEVGQDASVLFWLILEQQRAIKITHEGENQPACVVQCEEEKTASKQVSSKLHYTGISV